MHNASNCARYKLQFNLFTALRSIALMPHYPTTARCWNRASCFGGSTSPVYD
jgi:hypothetical protein